MGIKVGIDLGTTFSAVAMMDEQKGQPVIIPNTLGEKITPSVIQFTEDDEIIVGSEAKEAFEAGESGCAAFFKRNIGNQGACCSFNGKDYTAADLLAFLLRYLKKEVEFITGQTIETAVVTIPAYFGSEEKRAMLQAIRAADLDAFWFFTEPIAAVLSYCVGHGGENAAVLVYDLGGASFDVTVIKTSVTTACGGNAFQRAGIVTVGGNNLLGGKDWDDRLFNYILEAYCEETGLSPDKMDAETYQLIRSRVEATKKKLSYAKTARVRINANGSITSINVTREEFERITADLVAKAMTHVEKTLKRAGDISIDRVLLVGGSTYMPMIHHAVEKRFPGKVQFYEPDGAIAKGAAIYAGMMADGSLSDLPLDGGGIWIPKVPAPHTGAALPPAVK